MSKRKCIFCGVSGKLSREHVWAAWLRGYLPSDRGVNQVASRLGRIGNAVEFSVTDMRVTETAHYGDKTLRLVCAKCNNGWMSRLQNRVKPHLIPLMTSSGDGVIAEVALDILRKWLVMTTMVAEFTDMSGNSEAIAISEEDRASFARTLAIRDHWRIFIGRGADGLQKSGYDHFAVPVNLIWFSPPLRQREIVQASTMVIGDFVAYVFTSATKMAWDNAVPADKSDSSILRKLQPIWPAPNVAKNWFELPLLELDDLAEIQGILRLAAVK